MTEVPHREETPLVPLSAVDFVGYDLRRPECVLVAHDGTLFVSHQAVGVTRIDADGTQHRIGREGMPANGHELIPNGIHRRDDGSFLIANIGEGGGIWELSPEGKLHPFLMEVDGVFLAASNFVTQDSQDRIWITVSTISTPRFNAYSSKVADGLVILCDDRGTRIVADGLAFTNECRVDPAGHHLYVSETFGRRISRFPLRANGDLGARETFAQFGYGNFPDGCRFDDSGHLWLTSIVSNRLWRIAPDGRPTLILEDMDPGHVDQVEAALAEGRMGKEHFYTTGGEILHNIASVAFAGRDRRTVLLGALADTRIARFSMPA